MKWTIWLGPAVFVVSLALRLIGIGWGLPNDLHNESYHPDEPINFAVSQQVDPAHGNFAPGFYNYGTFYFTLAKIASAYCPMPDNFTPQTLPPFERCCLLAGRVISALAGAGTAWVLYALLARRTHILGATMGGLAAGLAPAFVVHSRFATVDVLATFLFAVSMLFALKMLPDQEGKESSHFLKWAILAGVFAGLSAGTKYTGAIALVGIYVSVFLTHRKDRPLLTAASTLAALVAFVVSTPGVLVDSQKFRTDLSYEMVHVATGQGLVFLDTPPAAIEHIISLEIGLGLLVLLFGVGGLLYAAYRRHAWAYIVLAFAISYYLIICRGQVKFLRYTFPLIPPLCVGFGWLAGQAHRRGDIKGRVIVGISIVGLGLQARDATLYTASMAERDPRDQAGTFFKDLAAKNPSLTVGVTDDPWFYTPALYQDVAMSRGQWQRIGLEKMSEATNPKVVYYRPYETPNVKPEYVTYSSLKSYDLQRLEAATDLKPDDQTAVNQWKATEAALKADYTPYERFGGTEEPRIYREDLEYVHPYVYVWKRKDLP